MQLLIFFYTFATKKDTAFELRDFLGKSFVNTFFGIFVTNKDHRRTSSPNFLVVLERK